MTRRVPMILQALRSKKRRQAGFTLIELLVVITVLGILAAIVSISLLGVTSTARKNALAAEKQEVQTAFDAMLHDQHVDPSQLVGLCDPVGAVVTFTDDMKNFPKGATPYAVPDPSRGGVVTVLSTHYLRETFTQSAKYGCDIDGNVLQQIK
jgi:prepilin-type N-terminal cleavage/methylation domain-containing protein